MNSDKTKMLCTGDYEPEWFPRFEEIFDTERKGFSLGDGSSMIVLKGEELVECLAGKKICIIGYDTAMEDIIKKSVDVELLLGVWDGPEENIDIDTYTATGTPVISNTGRCAVSVAELMFLLMPMLARPTVPMIEKIRSEGWMRQNSPSLRSMHAHQFTELYNKNLGTIGFGRNAKPLSVPANAFHMQVGAYDPHVNEEVMDSFHVKKVDSDQMVKTADYVIVLARLTPDTEGILNRGLIFSTKPTTSTVNMGRARLVDGKAILGALEQHVIKSMALDMYTPEPLDALSENWIHQIPEDGLIITSHAAGVTKEHPWHQYHLLYKQLLEYFQGNIPESCVNKQVFDIPQLKECGGKYFGIR